MREPPPVEGQGAVAPADAQREPREPLARSGEREAAEASERGPMLAAGTVASGPASGGGASAISAPTLSSSPALPPPPPPPPARAPSPAPHLTAPPAAYVPDFLGSFEGIEDGDGGGGAAGREEEVLTLLGSGRPVARAPRDSEPGGWVSVAGRDDDSEERAARRVSSSTPPAISRLSSLTLEDALSKTPRARARAVAASVAATVGGHGGGGPASSASPSSSQEDIKEGNVDKEKAKKKNVASKSTDGLLGGEASWWAAAAGSIYPSCPPPPDPMPTEAALWQACRSSCAAAAEAEPLLAPHILRVVAASSSLPEALAAVVLDRLSPSGASGDAEVAGATPPLPAPSLAAAALELTAAADLAAALFRDGSGVVSGVERMIASSSSSPRASNSNAAYSAPAAARGRFSPGRNNSNNNNNNNNNNEGSGRSASGGGGANKALRSPRITITSSLASLGGNSASSPGPLDSSPVPSPCPTPPPPPEASGGGGGGGGECSTPIPSPAPSPPPPGAAALSPAAPPPPPTLPLDLSKTTTTERTAGDVLLFHDGLHALAAQRVAARLWTSGQRNAALALQARTSAVLGADLHPAAAFAPGVLLCHPFGMVVGEAAVVGKGAVLCHAVTLGGNGKEKGDRHPKVGAGAMIGPRATVLGNIRIGENAKVASAALVLREVPPGALAAGSPASIVGCVNEIGWDL